MLCSFLGFVRIFLPRKLIVGVSISHQTPGAVSFHSITYPSASNGRPEGVPILRGLMDRAFSPEQGTVPLNNEAVLTTQSSPRKAQGVLWVLVVTVGGSWVCVPGVEDEGYLMYLMVFIPHSLATVSPVSCG
jgi:hypothetical protein